MGLTVISILTNAAPTRRLLPPNFPARHSAHRSSSFGASGAGSAIGVAEDIPKNPAKTTPLAPNPKHVLLCAPIKQSCPSNSMHGEETRPIKSLFFAHAAIPLRNLQL